MNNTISLHEHMSTHPEIANGNAIADVWTIHDILEMQDDNQQPYPLSMRAARKILANIQRNSTAEYGINWNSVENAISEYLQEHPPTSIRARVAIGAPIPGANETTGTFNIVTLELPTYLFEDHAETTNVLEDDILRPVFNSEFEALAKAEHPNALFAGVIDFAEHPTATKDVQSTQ